MTKITNKQLEEITKALEFELASHDAICPECDFPRSYRHKNSCEFPVYRKQDPSFLLSLIEEVKASRVELGFYGDDHNRKHLLGPDGYLDSEFDKDKGKRARAHKAKFFPEGV